MVNHIDIPGLDSRLDAKDMDRSGDVLHAVFAQIGKTDRNARPGGEPLRDRVVHRQEGSRFLEELVEGGRSFNQHVVVSL